MPARKATATTAKNEIHAWEDDPGIPSAPEVAVSRPSPIMGTGVLSVSIAGPKVAPSVYDPGTPEFRYWAGAEALQRAATFWALMLPSGTQWHSTVGSTLQAALD